MLDLRGRLLKGRVAHLGRFRGLSEPPRRSRQEPSQWGRKDSVKGGDTASGRWATMSVPARKGRVCSNDSPNGPGRSSFSPRTRLGRSSTTTSVRSTSCSGCCAKRKASPRGCSSRSTSPSRRSAPRSRGSSARVTRSRPVRSHSRRALRRCSNWHCAKRFR